MERYCTTRRQEHGIEQDGKAWGAIDPTNKRRPFFDVACIAASAKKHRLKKMDFED